MKRIYTTLFLSSIMVFSFAQSARKATQSDFTSTSCKNCIPTSQMVLDTLCNFESDDTPTLYFSDVAPNDSGYAIGHNAYQDKAWAERYTVSGSASVVGGIYQLFEASGSATSAGIATAHVYPTTGTGGKPGASMGSVAIPFVSMTNLSTGAGHAFSFTTPIAVTSSFFMGFSLGTYTMGGPDTIGIITSANGDRSTTNNDQNCAQWSDNSWYFEKTENFGLQINYGLCAIMDIAGGVENYVSKGDLSLYAAYPSPASSDVTVNYTLKNASKISLEIFDAQGKSISKINVGNQSAGTHAEKVDISSLSGGNYFYKVASENGTVYSTFSVVK